MILYTKVTFSLLVSASFLMVSCDSTEVPFGGVELSDITPTDSTVTAGELFTFQDILNPGEDQYLETIRVTADNIAVVGDISFDYEQASEFSALLTASIPTEESVNEAVEQMFSIANSANSEVRSLLAVSDASEDSPDLTEEELDRLIELMNVNGAGVSRHPDGSLQMVATPFVQYLMTSTSNQQDRSEGLIGGTYALEAASEVIIFQITTFQDEENNGFRFYLPVIGEETLATEVFEQGTYTLELNNTIGF